MRGLGSGRGGEGDRFIPSRAHVGACDAWADGGGESGQCAVLRFGCPTPPPPVGAFEARLGAAHRAGLRQARTPLRVIARTPERILDAPDLENDYYLNLMDWSEDGVLAVALRGVTTHDASLET